MIDRIKLYLDQMEMASSEACTFVKGMDKDAFLKDILTQRALGMTFVILGEAALRISREYPEILVDHPEIPWHEMIGIRNRLAHGYLTIDFNVVWETTQKSLPKLVSQLESLRNWRAEGE